jgi:quercetin dioxygenase-like cupin family protein
MNARRLFTCAAWVLTLAVGIGIGTAIGQQGGLPADTKGVDPKLMSTIDLAPDMAGYQLRIRKITFEPGGVVGKHSHKDRPSLTYILEGTLTEGREGGYSKEYKPGDVLTEGRDVTHWAENKGSSKLVLVGVDIVKP